MIFALTIPLGLLIGALLNVLADDLPARRAPSLPACQHCGQLHPPHYWLATLAYFFGGKCVHCGAPLRLRHVALELASVIALTYLGLRFGPTEQFIYKAVIVEILLLVTVIDLEHRLILRVVIYPAWVVALIVGLLDPARGLSKTLVGGAVGFGVTFVIYLVAGPLMHLLARLRGQTLDEVPFGWGDVNLSAFVGLAVGWTGIVPALFLAILSGGVGGLIFLLVMAVRRKATLFMVMPYGPYLALGGLVILVWGKDLAAWI